MNRRTVATALAAAVPMEMFARCAVAGQADLRCNSDSAREFMRSRLKSVLAASSVTDGLKAIPGIFAPDYVSHGGDEAHDLSWLEQHVREVQARLMEVEIEVTHAIRCGSLIASRHSVAAKTRADGKDWKIGVIGIYELTPEDRIRVAYQHGQLRAGEYSGW